MADYLSDLSRAVPTPAQTSGLADVIGPNKIANAWWNPITSSYDIHRTLSDAINNFVGKYFLCNGVAGKIIDVGQAEPDYYGSGKPRYFTILLDTHTRFYGGTYQIYDAPDVRRVIDYKIFPDFKTFFFTESNEWVVYHSEALMATDFTASLMAVECFNENDIRIYPTDVTHLPPIVSDGILETAKIIIRWAGPQTGKCIINRGYSNEEAGDQSRFIYSVDRWSVRGVDDPIKSFSINTAIEARKIATGIITTEPYMTVMPMSGGRSIQCAFIVEGSNDRENLISTYMKVRADLPTIKAIDAYISNLQYSNDIINTVSCASATIAEFEDAVISIDGLKSIIQDGAFNKKYKLLAGDFVATDFYDLLQTDRYDSEIMSVENFGVAYDPGQTKKHIMNVFCSSNRDSRNDWSRIIVPEQSPLPITTFLSLRSEEISEGEGVVSVISGELLKPMLKIPGIAGHVKIVKRVAGRDVKQIDNGLFEVDYCVEFPAVRGTYEFINSPGKHADSLGNLIFRLNHVFVMKSQISGGDGYKFESKRLVPSAEQLFTTVVASHSGFDVQTLDANNGGGYPANPEYRRTIQYPTESLFRRFEPNKINTTKSASSGMINVEMISDFAFSSIKFDGSAISCDLKLFVLNDGRKWKYDKDKFESYLGKENPSYIFEINATSLLQKFKDASVNPNLPELKRWLYTYCRGSALTMDPPTHEQVQSPNSSAELLMEIWDNESPVSDNGSIKGNWRSITPSRNDQVLYMDPSLEIPCDGVTAVTFVTDNKHIRLNTSAHGIKAGNYFGCAPLASNASKPAPTSYFKVESVYSDVITLESEIGFTDPFTYSSPIRAFYAPIFINSSEFFNFGDETVSSSYGKYKRFFDMIGPQKGLIDYFQFYDYSPYAAQSTIWSTPLQSETPGSRWFVLNNFGIGDGLQDTGYCQFRGIGTLVGNCVMGEDLFHKKNNIYDFSRNSSFSIGFGLQVEYLENSYYGMRLFRIGTATQYVQVEVDMAAYAEQDMHPLLRMTIAQPDMADVTVSSGDFPIFPYYEIDTIPFLFSKNGPVITIRYGEYVCLTYVMPDDDQGFDLSMDTGASIVLGDPANIYNWYRMWGFYIFNKPIATADELAIYMADPFISDGASDLRRYIDSDNKIYVRSRIKLPTASMARRLTIDTDGLPYNPWVDYSGRKFYRGIIIRSELPLRLTMDYIRASST